MQEYVTNPQVIHETIDGETIIIDLATGTYFSLQGAAPAIWSALAEGETATGVVRRLSQAYVAEPGEIESAVEGFLRELEREQLIATGSNGNGAGVMPAPSGDRDGAERSPLAPPKLEKYTDMQDIILLDPVHQVDSRGWPHAAPAETA